MSGNGGVYGDEDARRGAPESAAPPPPAAPPAPAESPAPASSDGTPEDRTPEEDPARDDRTPDGGAPGGGAPAPPLTAPEWPEAPGSAAPPATAPHDPGAAIPAAELPMQYATPPPPPAPSAYPAVHEPAPAPGPGPGPGPSGAYDPYAAYTPYPGDFELRPEADDRSRRRGVVVAVVGLAVIVGGALGAGGWQLLSDDGGKAAAKPQHSATAEPKPSPDRTDPAPTSAPPSSSPSESALPSGYVHATEDGYSLAVPEDWERRVDGVSVFYEEPRADGAFVQVYEVTEDISPFEAVQVIEETKREADGYRRNDLADLGTAAEYDYSYVDDQLGPRRVLLHDRETADGKMYALLVSGPEADWPRQREVLDAMTASLCTDTACPEPDGA